MSTSDDRDRRAPRDSRFVLVPALTFVVGLLLGGVLVWVGLDVADEPGADGADVAASPEATPGAAGSPTGSAPTEVVMTVPGQCVQAAQQAEEVLGLARQAADAIGELDALRLRSLVDQMEDLDPQIRASAEGCQDRADG